MKKIVLIYLLLLNFNIPLFGQISNDSLLIETCKNKISQALVNEFGGNFFNSHFILTDGNTYPTSTLFCPEGYRYAKFTCGMYESSKDSIFYKFYPSCNDCYNDEILERHFYKKFLRPQLKLLNGKLIGLWQVIAIAKKYNYEITEYTLDYYKNKKTKKYTRKIVWDLKQEIEPGVYKGIEINAKNGKIISQYTSVKID